MMQNDRSKIAGRRTNAMPGLRAALALAGALFACGCTTDQQVAGVPDVPPDYRMRHPITMKESDRTLEIFVGTNRGELNATQRAQVLAFGLKWRREATGGLVIARPVGNGNERAAADSMREIMSILAASGMPPNSIGVRTYQAGGPALATVRISYPKIIAQAGPCGIWPEDIGPSSEPRLFREPADVELRLRQPAQSGRHGRRSGRSGPAACRNRGLYDAAHHRDGEISSRHRNGDAAVEHGGGSQNFRCRKIGLREPSAS